MEIIVYASGMMDCQEMAELWFLVRIKEVLLQTSYITTVEEWKWVTNKANEMDKVFKSVGGV